MTTVKAEGNAQTDDSYFAGECGYCNKWRHQKVQCKKQKRDHQGGNLTAATHQTATVQAVATVGQIQWFSSDVDSFWVLAVSVPCRDLVDRCANEHFCSDQPIEARSTIPTDT